MAIDDDDDRDDDRNDDPRSRRRGRQQGSNSAVARRANWLNLIVALFLDTLENLIHRLAAEGHDVTGLRRLPARVREWVIQIGESNLTLAAFENAVKQIMVGLGLAGQPYNVVAELIDTYFDEVRAFANDPDKARATSQINAAGNRLMSDVRAEFKKLKKGPGAPKQGFDKLYASLPTLWQDNLDEWSLALDGADMTAELAELSRYFKEMAAGEHAVAMKMMERLMLIGEGASTLEEYTQRRLAFLTNIYDNKMTLTEALTAPLHGRRVPALERLEGDVRHFTQELDTEAGRLAAHTEELNLRFGRL